MIPATNRTERSEHDLPLRNRVVGTACLYGGAGLVLLAILDGISNGSLPLPGFWYRNRPLFGIFAVAAFFVAAKLLLARSTSAERDQAGWKARLPGVRFRDVTVYSRDGCHLCDTAVETLAAYSEYFETGDIHVVDIDTDPNLIEQFGLEIPVIAIDGKVRFKGRVDETLIRRLIDASPVID